MTDHGVDYYAVLGVSAQADAAEIIRAYRRALRRLHPDTRDDAPEAAERRPAGAGAELALVREAFTVLGDPERRAGYDRSARPTRASRRPPAATRTRGSYLTDPPDPPLRAGPVRYRPSRSSGGDR
jgi:curved DNA-binding protein CbpA